MTDTTDTIQTSGSPAGQVSSSPFPPGQGRPVLLGDERYQLLQRFYLEEAAVLDEDDLISWQTMLDPRLNYRMAVRREYPRAQRVTRSRSESYHLEDNYASVCLRIRRYLESPRAWSEDPPSRTRRFVSNLMVDEMSGDSASAGLLATSTYLLLVRNHGDEPTYEFLSARRVDRVDVATEGSRPRLVDRSIIIDQLRIGVRNLALFL
jgi:3-phenylpropionate/cinnamic acid dioxygenase small subunit